ncbi:MAG: aminopeptidase P family protein [Cyanobacteria bacterium NC_groundwater_1444_Ag_S-0.65um_54_12]|nr:aminopeptidase P family protein [Cyanobacteria bacterium NC_groundwater_1444_Ag_S-0.65um_54_12]
MVCPKLLARVQRLCELLRHSALDGLLVSDPANIRFLTDFSGSWARLLVGVSGELLLIIDTRYLDQAAQEVAQCQIIAVNGTQQIPAICRASKLLNPRKLGFEPGAISWWEQRAIESCLPRSCHFVAQGGQVEELRLLKDKGDIADIRRAAQATDRAITEIIGAAELANSEQELRANLAAALGRYGNGPSAFEPIVTSGPRTALIHAKPAARKIVAGDLLLLDAGATHDGWCADVCRTVVVREVASELQRTVFTAVKEALIEAITAIRPGKSAAAVASAARDTLAQHGFPLRHDLGHGIGLEVHEEPRIAIDSTAVLQAGMVVAVEPAVYLPGWGGIRLEETVLVTQNGCEVLSCAPLALAI